MYLTLRIRKKLNTKYYIDLDKWGQSVDDCIVAISQTLRSHGIEFCVPPIDYKAGLVIYSPAAPVVFKAIANIYCNPWYLKPFQYHHYNQQIKNKVGGEVCQSQPTVSSIWTCAEPEFWLGWRKLYHGTTVHVYTALLHTLFHSKNLNFLIFKWEGNCHFDKFNITFTLLNHVTHLLIIFLKIILDNKTAVTIFFSLQYSIESKYKPRLFKLYHTFPELPPAVIQFRENSLVG